MGISYKKVKEIAVSKGMKSDNAICERCKIPNGTFYDWKNGSTKTLSEQNISKLASGLGVSVSQLFDEEPQSDAEELFDAHRVLMHRVGKIENKLSEADKKMMESILGSLEEKYAD